MSVTDKSGDNTRKSISRTVDSGLPGRVAAGRSRKRSFSEFSSISDDGKPCSALPGDANVVRPVMRASSDRGEIRHGAKYHQAPRESTRPHVAMETKGIRRDIGRAWFPYS